MFACLSHCFSGSNSTVERAFSVLNLILGDRQLSLGNQAMKDIMIVKCNDRNWGFQEKSEIIERALEIYMMNRRVGLPSNVEEPAEKIMGFEMPVGNSADSDLADSDSCSTSNTNDSESEDSDMD